MLILNLLEYIFVTLNLKFPLCLFFSTFAETKTNHTLKVIKIYNAKEFLSIVSYLNKHSIRRRLTCPHTHQQHELIERKHIYVVDTRLSLLARDSLPKKL